MSSSIDPPDRSGDTRPPLGDWPNLAAPFLDPQLAETFTDQTGVPWRLEVATLAAGDPRHATLAAFFRTPPDAALVIVTERELRGGRPRKFIVERIGLPDGAPGARHTYAVLDDDTELALATWQIRVHARRNPGYAEWSWLGDNAGESRLVFPGYRTLRPSDAQILEARAGLDYLRDLTPEAGPRGRRRLESDPASDWKAVVERALELRREDRRLGWDDIAGRINVSARALRKYRRLYRERYPGAGA